MRVRLLFSETRPAAQPPVCLVCGRPAAIHVAKQFVWQPSWLRYSIWPALCCFFPAAIVILVAGILQTRRAVVETPLCERHRGYWNWRGFWVYFPLFVLLLAAIAFAVLFFTKRLEDEGWIFLLLGNIAALIGWLVFALILQRRTIRAVEITDTDISLEPVSAAYVSALSRERREQDRRPLAPSDEYDPYPRRR